MIPDLDPNRKPLKVFVRVNHAPTREQIPGLESSDDDEIQRAPDTTDDAIDGFTIQYWYNEGGDRGRLIQAKPEDMDAYPDVVSDAWMRLLQTCDIATDTVFSSATSVVAGISDKTKFKGYRLRNIWNDERPTDFKLVDRCTPAGSNPDKKDLRLILNFLADPPRPLRRSETVFEPVGFANLIPSARQNLSESSRNTTGFLLNFQPNNIGTADGEGKLGIFRTKHRGWGLETVSFIRAGQHVTSLYGELISPEEARRRTLTGGGKYIREVVWSDGDGMGMIIDAERRGSIARFINHSCEPNLHCHAIVSRTQVTIQFYAKQAIEANEELTCDYFASDPFALLDEYEEHSRDLCVGKLITTSGQQFAPPPSNINISSEMCKCGSANCRRIDFADALRLYNDCDNDDDEQEWTVDEIIGVRKGPGPTLQYRIKWFDFDDEEDNTWECVSNLSGCGVSLARFWLHRALELVGEFRMISKSKYCSPQKYQPPRPHLANIPARGSSNGIRVPQMNAVHSQNDRRRAREHSDELESIAKRAKLDEQSEQKVPVVEPETPSEKLWHYLSENAVDCTTLDLISVHSKVSHVPMDTGFEYISDYEAGGPAAERRAIDAVLKDSPIVGCRCGGDCFHNRKQCCNAVNVPGDSDDFPYTRKGLIKLHSGRPVYECNRTCACRPDCVTRVVQRGRKYKTEIYDTMHVGLGVRAQERIPQGAFVMEYIGEVILRETAADRMRRTGGTYLLALDFNDPVRYKYVIDAERKGNLAHFVNHSCDPNLQQFAVYINVLNIDLPRVAFFARRTIEKGEELTFDYFGGGGADVATYAERSVHLDPNGNGSFVAPAAFQCKCRASNCRGKIF